MNRIALALGFGASIATVVGVVLAILRLLGALGSLTAGHFQLLVGVAFVGATLGYYTSSRKG